MIVSNEQYSFNKTSTLASLNLINSLLIRHGSNWKRHVFILLNFLQQLKKASPEMSPYKTFLSFISKNTLRLNLVELGGARGRKKFYIPLPPKTKYFMRKLFLKKFLGTATQGYPYKQFGQRFNSNLLDLQNHKGTLHKSRDETYILAKQNKFRLKKSYPKQFIKPIQNVNKKSKLFYI